MRDKNSIDQIADAIALRVFVANHGQDLTVGLVRECARAELAELFSPAEQLGTNPAGGDVYAAMVASGREAP